MHINGQLMEVLYPSSDQNHDDNRRRALECCSPVLTTVNDPKKIALKPSELVAATLQSLWGERFPWSPLKP